MNNFNLNDLPPANIITELDYEQLLNERKSKLLSLLPTAMKKQWRERLELESEPVLKLLQADAYRELELRAHINQAARACMIAYASGGDLDNLAANFGVKRLQISAVNNEVAPPIAAVFEDDASLRQRTIQAFHGLSVAGPAKSYEFYAKNAHGGILDVKVLSPSPAVVDIIVLAKNNEGVPSASILGAVEDVLNADDVRPIGDLVKVMPCEIVHYRIKAKIYATQNKSEVGLKSKENLQQLVNHYFKIGQSLPLSAIYAALHLKYVDKVELITPAQDLTITAKQALYCDLIDLNLI